MPPFKTPSRALLPQLSWFVVVGCVAALTHWGVVVLCVETWALHPLIANGVAWLVAFQVSLLGHYYLSFRNQVPAFRRAALRFFGVAALAFVCNELAYAALLHATMLSYETALVLVLVAVASLTFVLSRTWAFRRANIRR